MAMLEIDGARGEGGGQILRSSLALSLVTGTPSNRYQATATGGGVVARQYTTDCADARPAKRDATSEPAAPIPASLRRSRR
jgi:hypothetical protein